MRPSVRFLLLAILGWTSVRAMTLDAIPGDRLLGIIPSEARSPPPIVATHFPPIEPIIAPESEYSESSGFYQQAAQPWPAGWQPVAVPIHYAAAPAPSSPPEALSWMSPDPAPHSFAPISTFADWPRLAAVSIPAARPVLAPIQSKPAVVPRNALDRVQLTSWALLRGQQGMAFGTPSLAPYGTLGGSQAGARLTYNFTRQISANLRTSSDVGRRGAEVAAGMRVQPLSALPLWLTAERRQRIGSGGTGRSAFALFAEGGVYQQSVPWGFDLDAYWQAGVVGLRKPDAFIDGSATLTRPVFRQFAAGLGFWGAAQPGVYRVDGGPRVTMKVRNNLRIHFDWRQRLAGNAAPASGPAITLAGDF